MPWKIIWATVSALFLLWVGVAALQAQDSLKVSPVPQTSGQSEVVPKISVPAKTFKFKSVPDGSEIKHDFVIQNLGDAPLRIESVKTG